VETLFCVLAHSSRSSMPLLDSLTRRVSLMPLLDLNKLTAGLSLTWAGFLRDWDRSLRAGNSPETTRYNYLLAAAQLGRYLAEYSPDPDADDAAEDPTAVTRAHVEAFQAWMIATRSPSTALNQHKGLQQFFRWLAEDKQEITRSPMERVRQPSTPTKLIPVIRDEDTKRLLEVCKGKGFVQLRDEAILRLLYNTGARLSEVGNLTLDDVDLATESVHFRGKGAKDRRVRFGAKTARALSRYLRSRAKHKGRELPDLWLAERGARPLTPNGIEIRLKRLGEAAGVADVHAHRWRHSFAHEWKRAGGDTGDLMLLLGWTSEDMPPTTGPAPPPHGPRRPSSAWASASGCERCSDEHRAGRPGPAPYHVAMSRPAVAARCTMARGAQVRVRPDRRSRAGLEPATGECGAPGRKRRTSHPGSDLQKRSLVLVEQRLVLSTA
jgi:integrase/recombinase XerC